MTLSSLPTIQWCETHSSAAGAEPFCEDAHLDASSGRWDLSNPDHAAWIAKRFGACRIVPKHLIDLPGDADG